MKNKSSKSVAKTDPDLKKRVLQAILAHVPFDGWSETSYEAALKQSGITRAEADKQFPEGMRSIVEAFGIMADDAMGRAIKNERGFVRMRVRDKITFAIRARLESLTPHREAVRRLMMWYALPHHAPMGISRFAKTVDLMWIAAGDTATDYNYYTKRILLGAVLKAVILFWLNDETPDHAATWEFLDRRIADIMKLGKSISLLKEFKPSEIVDLVKDKIRKVI